MEEESNIASFVVGSGVGKVSIGFAKSLSKFFPKFDSVLPLEVILLDVLELKIIDNKSGGNDMILVDSLDESLDSSLFDEFLLVNFPLHSLRVSGDTGDDDMRELVFLRC